MTTKKKWISGALSALAIGGLLAAAPLTSSAVETAPPAKTPPAVTAPQQGAGGCGGGGMMQGGMMQDGMMGGMMGGMYGGIVADTVYKITGLEKQEVIEARQAGKSFVAIAKAKGISEDQLLAAVKKDHKAFIDQKVKDGVMTQEMADNCTKNFAANIKSMLENTGSKGSRGKGLSNGMMNGMMNGGMMNGMMKNWQQQASPVQGTSV